MADNPQENDSEFDAPVRIKARSQVIWFIAGLIILSALLYFAY